MTSETLKAKMQAIPTEDLLKQARPALQRFIEGKGKMCIPAQPYDDDMVLSEALDRLEEVQRELDWYKEHAISFECHGAPREVAPAEERRAWAAEHRKKFDQEAPPQPKPKSNVVLIAESRLSILDAAYAYWAYDGKRDCIAFEDAMQQQLMEEDVRVYINRIVSEGQDEADLAKLKEYICVVLERPDAWPKEAE
jgi:hypothetical protein